MNDGMGATLKQILDDAEIPDGPILQRLVRLQCYIYELREAKLRADRSRLVSDMEAALLAKLAIGGEAHGYQLYQRSNGQIKLGSVYVLLDRLRRKGLIEHRLGSGEHNQTLKIYRLTPAGEQAINYKGNKHDGE